MQIAVNLPLEALAAQAALVELLGHVRPHMRLQIAQLVRALAADQTQQHLLSLAVTFLQILDILHDKFLKFSRWRFIFATFFVIHFNLQFLVLSLWYWLHFGLVDSVLIDMGDALGVPDTTATLVFHRRVGGQNLVWRPRVYLAVNLIC